MTFCPCGCGGTVSPGRKWIKGHNRSKGYENRLRATPNGCIEWAGPVRPDGYGKGPKGWMAHRYAYLKANGDPGGLCVCHRCDNPLCCNPDHLFLGTAKDNIIDAALKGRVRGQSLTHCKHGHEFTPENTYHRVGTISSRDCRACIRARVANYKRKRAA